MSIKTIVAIVLSLFVVFVLAVVGIVFFMGTTPRSDVALSTQTPIATEVGTPEATSGAAVASTGVVLSSSEIAQHSTRDSCWLLISGKVYDVTSFIADHPGGSRDILKNCGKDATNDYATQDGEGEHSSQANAMLADYYIGNKDAIKK